MALLFGVFFSRKAAIRTESSVSRSSNRSWLSSGIFSSFESCPKRPLRTSNSSRRDGLLTLGTGFDRGGYSPASTAISPAKTARRSAGGIRS